MPRRFMIDPFQEMRRELDSVFERFVGEGFAPPSLPMSVRRGEGAMISPQLDVRMKGDALEIKADLPGVDPENLDCSVQNGMLTIKGERREERNEDGGHVLKERRFGRFERRLSLPEGIDEDNIQAQFDKGVLTITAPMKSGVGQQRKIQIAGPQKQGSQQPQMQQQGQASSSQSMSGQGGTQPGQGGQPMQSPTGSGQTAQGQHNR